VIRACIVMLALLLAACGPQRSVPADSCKYTYTGAVQDSSHFQCVAMNAQGACISQMLVESESREVLGVCTFKEWR
jgi:hypothetical protein